MKKPRGRPRGEKTVLINIPVTRIEAASRVLGRPVAENQTPFVRVRVTEDERKRLREAFAAEADR